MSKRLKKPGSKVSFKSFLNLLLGKQSALVMNFLGALSITLSTSFFKDNGAYNPETKEIYSMVVATHPNFFRLGLLLTIIGFILQFLEKASITYKFLIITIVALTVFLLPIYI